MAKLSTDNLLDAFKDMTLLELSDFVKQFEDVFDVKAAAPLPGPALQDGHDGTPPAEAEEQDEFDVILVSAGDKKIPVVKVVREVISGLGLKEAKDLVESAPTAILEKVSRDVAEAARDKFEAVGAIITFK